jgi:hypothetical protein
LQQYLPQAAVRSRSKTAPYSITSSACVSNVGASSSPLVTPQHA